MKRFFSFLLIVMMLAAMTGCRYFQNADGGGSSAPEGADTSGKWPSDRLPEDFPEALYQELLSVEESGSVIKITMLGTRSDMTSTAEFLSSANYFTSGARGRYSQGIGENFESLTYHNTDGYEVIIDGTEFYKMRNKISGDAQFDKYRFTLSVEKTEKIYLNPYPDLGLETLDLEVWPSDLLPPDFPKPPDGTRIIRMRQATYGIMIYLSGALNDEGPKAYTSLLKSLGYVYYDESFYMDEKHDRVYISRASARDNPEPGDATIYRVVPAALDPAAANVTELRKSFERYPSLGLPEKSFDKWPSDALPDGFPKPPPGVTVSDMRQDDTGVYITCSGSEIALTALTVLMANAGYTQEGNDEDMYFINSKLDRCYLESMDSSTGAIKVTLHIIRGDLEAK